MNAGRRQAWLADERAVEVAPRFAPRVGDPVPRRLNYVAGRTLTEQALRTEQTWRDRRFAMLGRGLEPGIIEGLGVEVLDAGAGTAMLRVLPGSGLTSSGEDIALGRPLTTLISDIPPAAPLAEASIQPRGLVVLLLQPVRGVMAAGADPEDPCPTDIEAYAYADVITLDGARLVWLRLDSDPTVELPAAADLPRPVPPASGGEPALLGPLSSRNVLLPPRPLIGRTESLLVPQTVARNTTAHRLINQEADTARLGKEPPWAEFGLPLAVLQVGADGNIIFADRFAVARMGGAVRQAVPSSGIGLPLGLQRARFDQFLDQLRHLQAEGAALAPAALHFRTLPPIGLLPASLLDMVTLRSNFFPPNYVVEAAPIPIPQLEAALGDRASLAAFDLARGDYVQILVPVPEPLFEPRLLLRETPAEAVIEAVRQTRIVETAKRALVEDLQGMEASLIGAIELAKIADPVPKPTDAKLAPRRFEDEVAEIVAGLHREVEALPVGPAELDAIAPGGFEEMIATVADDGDRGALAFRGLKPVVDDLAARLDKANDFVDLSFVRLQADIYRARQNLVGDEDKSRLATSPVLANLATSVTGLEASQKINELFLAGEKRRPPQPVTALTLPGADNGPGTGSGTGGGVGPGAGFSGGIIGLAPNLAGSILAQPVTADTGFLNTAILGQAASLSTIGDAVTPAAPLLSTTSLTAAAFSSEFGRFKFDLAEANLQANTIALQGLIFGKTSPVRTVTLAERLRPSPAQEAKNAAVVTKAEIAGGVQDLGLNLSGLKIPLSGGRTALVPRDAFDGALNGLSTDAGTVFANDSAVPVIGDLVVVSQRHLERSVDTLFPDADDALAGEVSSKAAELLALRADLNLANLASLILDDRLDPDPPDADEGAFYAAAVDALESAVSMLRLIEQRIRDYQRFLDGARAALIRLIDLSESWQGAIDNAEADLAEAVHDKTVAAALLEEETERVDAINQRRTDILANNVETIAFVRPRALDRFKSAPGMDLVGPRFDPIPACLEGGDPPPEELQMMVDDLREAPVGWFPALAAQIDQINRPSDWQKVYQAVPGRADFLLDHRVDRTQGVGTIADQRRVAGKAATSVQFILHSSQAFINEIIAVRASLKPDEIAHLGWRAQRDRVSKDLSIEDLRAAGPAGANVNREGLRELGRISAVASCFLATLRETPAAIRFGWAETLSVHDDVPDLSDILRAEGWGSLPFEQRRVLEHMHRWLFDQIDSGIDGARRAMSEIVRVCLLLSSHAPVSRIVEGQPVETKTLVPEETFEVAVDKGEAAVGMIASFAGGKGGLGVITDIIGTKALVQVTQAPKGKVSVSPDDAVLFNTPVQTRLVTGTER